MVVGLNPASAASGKFVLLPGTSKMHWALGRKLARVRDEKPR